MLPVVEEPVEVVVPFGLLDDYRVPAVQPPAGDVLGRRLDQGAVPLVDYPVSLGDRGQMELGGFWAADTAYQDAEPDTQSDHTGHHQESPEDYRRYHGRVSHLKGIHPPTLAARYPFGCQRRLM